MNHIVGVLSDDTTQSTELKNWFILSNLIARSKIGLSNEVNIIKLLIMNNKFTINKEQLINY